MSEPIREALEKAAGAVLQNLSDRKGIGNELEQCDDETKAEIGRTVAAKAIAAFLRALPDQYSEGGSDFWGAIPAEEDKHHWLSEAAILASKQDRLS